MPFDSNGSLPKKHDLRKAGLKVTLPRIKILSILESSSKRHVSAEDIYRSLIAQGEDIGLATVYRVLTQFETSGLVTRLHFEGGNSVFELNEGEHHDHLVCVRCGKVDEFIDREIEEAQERIVREFGYEMTDHSLHIFGLCPNCRLSEP